MFRINRQLLHRTRPRTFTTLSTQPRQLSTTTNIHCRHKATATSLGPLRSPFIATLASLAPAVSRKMNSSTVDSITTEQEELVIDDKHPSPSRVICIAIDDSGHSRHACQWSVDNLLNSKTDQVVLLNVRTIHCK